MSLNLPGYYFDPERNRYFPITSSTPAHLLPNSGGRGSSSQPRNTTDDSNRRKRRKTVSSSPVKENLPATALPSILGSSVRKGARAVRSNANASFAERSLVHHQLEAHAISRTRMFSEEELPLGPGCRITALAVSEDPEGYQVAGDDRGWLFVRQPRSTATAEQVSLSYEGRFDENGIYISPMRWFCDMGLMTKITSVALIQDRFFVSSFGPHAKILVGALDATQETDVSAFILEPAKAYDLWTAVFESNGHTGSATLGLHSKAMHIQDLDNRMSMRNLHTGSDVISVCKKQHAVYTGERSGTIRLFDLRSGAGSTGSPLIKMGAMITNIDVYRDWEMITAAANGELQSFDMRFMRREQGGATKPLLDFNGHKNTHMHDLGFTVLPSGDFVVAAGIDRKIRAWSTRTGEQVPSPAHKSPRGLLDDCALEDDTLAIGANGGQGLWSAGGRSVRYYKIGSGLGSDAQ